ncbi:SDR family oxidoreductase [Flavobacterium sp. AC]|uniref:SDR family oxidoreductase n=1 Tax=Flavobacterium azizsancarii TaxID=2961580 RepID=A0ABT4WJA8_9FLAO|nr:SDR family oxidoreductase [Flavobacterium azizsancarii]MDA6072679.1 SDR family oxidoreductase [Flavobacterium azizsancarii]
MDENTLSAIRTSQIAENPISKLGDSNDIAKMVVYLSGDSASFITGSDFVIDGGKTIKV